MIPPKSEDFRNALSRKFEIAEKEGDAYIEIRSGDLHKEVGGYPKPHNRMPICCDVMYSSMSFGDTIIKSPKKGRGANLFIQYLLPRTKSVDISRELSKVEEGLFNQDINDDMCLCKTDIIPDPQIQSVQSPPNLSLPLLSTIQDLEDLSKTNPEFHELEDINLLIKIKPSIAIVTMRKFTENIIRLILTRAGMETYRCTFGEMCGQLKYSGLVNEKIMSYINSIRISGNIAVHDSSVKFHEKDAIIIGNMVCEFVRSVSENKLI